MNRITVFVSVILLSETVLNVFGQNENCYDLGQCVTLLKSLTSDENMAFAHTEEHLETLCVKLKEAVQCVNTFIKRCLDSSSQVQYEAMTNGTQKLIKDLCTKGTNFRTEYLKHAKCYHKYQNEYKFCAEQYYSNYEKIKDNVNEDQETQIKNWCCNFDGHRKCTYDTVLGKCGEDAANLAQNIVLTAGGVLVDAHCRNYTYDSPLCSSASCSPTLSKRVILLFLSILSFFTWFLPFIKL
jgi:hypothetical protein